MITPKLNIVHQPAIPHLRSGWPYAMHAIKPLHNEKGVLFDGQIEETFLRSSAGAQSTGCLSLPYKQAWVGFIHHPPTIPDWYGASVSASAIIQSSLFQDSLPFCQGIFTLSAYMQEWLRERLTVPVNRVLHPTETPDLKFTLDNFYANRQRFVLHAGWWLRKFHSFYLLKVRNFEKLLLLPCRSLREQWPALRSALLTERQLATGDLPPCKVAFHQDNETYDQLMSSNIVFLDLYDSSANNTVVECIVRNTPVVIGRHPAVAEYLGEDYPLYFSSLAEAEQLIEDERAIVAAHEYLVASPIKQHLSAEAFQNSISGSEIYSRLSAG
jgi:hypothetical protein